MDDVKDRISLYSCYKDCYKNSEEGASSFTKILVQCCERKGQSLESFAKCSLEDQLGCWKGRKPTEQRKTESWETAGEE